MGIKRKLIIPAAIRGRYDTGGGVSYNSWK